MFDDPYKFVRDILVNSTEVTQIIPAKNIRNLEIPDSLKTQAPYIRISIIEMTDIEFADGQIRAAGLHVQIDIWQPSPLMTVGNRIKKLLKEKGFGFTASLEPQTEKVTDYLTLYRDARRYFYAYELNENQIY